MKPTQRCECCSPLTNKESTRLTFEDNLQLVPQNVKDAVAGARLRDDVSLQPTPAGVLVEIITRLHGLIHVLQEPSGFGVTGTKKRGKGREDPHVVGKTALCIDGGLTQFAK